MILKEYAEGMYNKFYNLNTHSNSVQVRKDLAKEHSILAVKAVIEALNQAYDSTDTLHFYETEQYEFYKKAIEIIKTL